MDCGRGGIADRENARCEDGSSGPGTLVGIAVGVACKWVASFVFYRIFGEDYRGVGM
jgi:hypothetical protein